MFIMSQLDYGFVQNVEKIFKYKKLKIFKIIKFYFTTQNRELSRTVYSSNFPRN